MERLLSKIKVHPDAFWIRKGLEVTTSPICINECAYCPREKFTAACMARGCTEQLSVKTFKKCLGKIPKTVLLIFSGFSEPWTNPHCTEMILYAHEQGFKIVIYSTIVGMDYEDINKIKTIPFVKFFIHLPDSKNRAKIKINKKYLNLFTKLISSNIKNLVLISLFGYDKIHPQIKQLLRGYDLPFYSWPITSRAGNLPVKKWMRTPQRREGKLPLCFRLYINVLIPNGDVVLCCCDFGLKHVLGNLTISTYSSLFKSKEFSKIMEGLSDNSLDILCRVCGGKE